MILDHCLNRRRLLSATGPFFTSAFVPAPVFARRTADAFTHEFRQWCAANTVEAASMAVRRHGRLTASPGVGSQRSDAPAPVASLSKAITALCFSRLVDKGLADFDATLGDVLAPFIDRTRLPVDRQVAAITFGQMLSQRSGLVAGVPLPSGPDDVQGNMRSPLEEQVRRVLGRALVAAPGTRFIYGNSNYQLVALAIEAISGKSYTTCCHEQLLRPLGIGKAYLGDSHLYAARSGAGGWFMSAEDFTLVADQLAPDAQGMGAKTRAWLAERRTETPVYGLGSVSRAAGGGVSAISHNGTLKYADVSASSAFVKWSNGWTVALNLRPNRNEVLPALLERLDAIALQL